MKKRHDVHVEACKLGGVAGYRIGGGTERSMRRKDRRMTFTVLVHNESTGYSLQTDARYSRSKGRWMRQWFGDTNLCRRCASFKDFDGEVVALVFF